MKNHLTIVVERRVGSYVSGHSRFRGEAPMPWGTEIKEGASPFEKNDAIISHVAPSRPRAVVLMGGWYPPGVHEG